MDTLHHSLVMIASLFLGRETMGRSRIIPRLLYIQTFLSRAGKVRHTPMEWKTKEYGRPTPENIDKWVTSFEQSCVDGPNKHLGLDPVVSARIYDQINGRDLAEWTRKAYRPNEPKFQVVS